MKEETSLTDLLAAGEKFMEAFYLLNERDFNQVIDRAIATYDASSVDRIPTLTQIENFTKMTRELAGQRETA